MLDKKAVREATRKKLEKYIYDQSVTNQFYHEKRRKSPFSSIEPLFPHSPSPQKQYNPHNVILSQLRTPKSSKSPQNHISPSNSYTLYSSRSPINTPIPKTQLISIVEQEKTLQKYLKALRKKDLKNFPANFAITKEGKIFREDKQSIYEGLLLSDNWVNQHIVRLFEYLVSVNLTNKAMPRKIERGVLSPKFSKNFTFFGNSIKTKGHQEKVRERQEKEDKEKQKISHNNFKRLFQSFQQPLKNLSPSSKLVVTNLPKPLQITSIQQKLQTFNKQKQANISKKDPEKDSRSRVFTFSSNKSRQKQVQQITPEKNKEIVVKEIKTEIKQNKQKKRNRSYYCTAPVEEDTSLHQKYENTLRRLEVLKQKVYQQSKLRESFHKQQEQSVDLIHLYKKYSPLKKLTQLIEYRKHDRKQNR